MNSFGDERLLIEKYLADAHHLEFQTFGDKHGTLSISLKRMFRAKQTPKNN
ncbi:MAG: hypothetical protein IPJ46_07700 [Anaerolineales bacterium]|nr:hypothetical protein [Anaerolineales bacterium]